MKYTNLLFISLLFSCFLLNAQVPNITIEKRALDGANVQYIPYGGTATFEITVTNSGAVDLENVIVTDVMVSSCNITIGTLFVGQVVSYTCSDTNVTIGFLSTIDVTGEPVGGGNPVADFDDSEVVVLSPGISVDMHALDGADIQYVNMGGTAFFEIVVTNTGAVDLQNVVNSDPISPACDMAIATLAVGETFTYTCSISDVVASFTSTAHVAADPVGGGNPVTDSNGTDVALALQDTDSDGVPDADDNCPGVPNPFQSDCNNNGVGDACDSDYTPPLFSLDQVGSGIMLIIDDVGNCWTVKIGADGVLTAVQVDCPN